MKCPYCSHENDEQAKTCERCKAALPHDTKKDDKPVKASKAKKGE